MHEDPLNMTRRDEAICRDVELFVSVLTYDDGTNRRRQISVSFWITDLLRRYPKRKFGA